MTDTHQEAQRRAVASSEKMDCPKTLSGNHHFIKTTVLSAHLEKHPLAAIEGLAKGEIPICMFCGIADDISE